MPIATVTSKGQVTIPKRVRERLHLRAGDRLLFSLDEDDSVRLVPIATKVADAFGAFSDKAQKAVSNAEIRRRLKAAFREGKV